MNNREKERYLREYSILKSQGKPFFPYAILKDSMMAIITLVVIILMSLILGAELGPKADPTTTTYTPRPEWYFFFLFELLRVVKPPALVFVATVGIPTVCMVLLILLPFIDRNPERHPLKRPIATFAGITIIIAMAYLTLEGALSRATDTDRPENDGPVRARQERDGLLRLPRLPPRRRERQRRPGAATSPTSARSSSARRSRGR